MSQPLIGSCQDAISQRMAQKDAMKSQGSPQSLTTVTSRQSSPRQDDAVCLSVYLLPEGPRTFGQGPRYSQRWEEARSQVLGPGLRDEIVSLVKGETAPG